MYHFREYFFRSNAFCISINCNKRTQAKVNEDPKDALLRKLQDEINKLKQELDEQGKLLLF